MYEGILIKKKKKSLEVFRFMVGILSHASQTALKLSHYVACSVSSELVISSVNVVNFVPVSGDRLVSLTG